MASFTDKAPQFNPYIAQKPVEAMVKVGMYKQQKYEEGYQKIQQSIDKVAGMDIARDVDKSYLQGKLNDLGSDLRGVAAGDFSNFQLTNSVAGMSSKIVQDQSVQSAVSSTARLRSETARRKVLEKEGKTDANNDAYFAKSVNDYMSNEEMEDANGDPISFNSSYVEYTDIVGEMRTALKDSGLDETIAEQIFVMDGNKPMRNEDGQLIYADYKTIEKLETNKEAVQAALNTVLSQGNVRQQLQIDGWAKYKDTEVESLLVPMRETISRGKAEVAEQRLAQTALLSATNLTDEDREIINKKIAVADKTEAMLEGKRLEFEKQATNNPEGFKQGLYEQQYRQNLNSLFTKEKGERTFDTNPAKQQQNWQRTFNFNAEKERINNLYKDENLKLAAAAVNQKNYEFDVMYPINPKTGLRYKLGSDSDPSVMSANGLTGAGANGIVFEGDQSGEERSGAAVMEEKINSLGETKNTIGRDMIVDLKRQEARDSQKPIADIMAEITKEAEGKGVPVNEYIDNYVTDIYNKYDELGLIPSSRLDDQFSVHQETSEALQENIELKDAIKVKAYRDFHVGEAMAEMATKPGIDFADEEGNPIHLTAAEVFQIQDLQNQYTLVASIPRRGERVQGQVIDTGLNDNQEAFLRAHSNAYNVIHTAPTQLRPGEMTAARAVRGEYESYQPINDKYNGRVAQAEAEYSEQVNKVIREPGSRTGVISIDSGKGVLSRNVGLLGAYVGRSSKINLADGQKRAELDEALRKNNINTITYKSFQPDTPKGEWTGEIIVNTHEGGVFNLTQVSQENLEKLTGQTFGEFKTTPIKNRLQGSTTGSTNLISFPNDPDAWKTAYLKNGDNASDMIKAEFVYRADVVQDSKGYHFVHYIKSGKEGKFYTIEDTNYAPTEFAFKEIFKTTTLTEVKDKFLKHRQSLNK
jgi:hypothetical protein